MELYFLGIDIGTSSVRAVLFDEKGRQKSMESIDCSIISSFEGFAELEPDMIFNYVINVISKCIAGSGVQKAEIAAMGMSCHMHSLMMVDSKGNPLSRLMIWADTRAKREAKFIEDNYNINELYNITGCRVQHPMYPLSKILWIKNNEADLFKRTAKFITIKEYIIYKLFGEYVVDYTLAASQGFLNIHKQEWDEFILSDILGIGKDKLSTVVECTHVLKGMKQEYADILGVDENVPMVIGSGDGIMANLGCGVFDDTSLSSTIGTSGAIRTSVSSPLLDPQQRTWCYSFTKDTWVTGGAINNGGIVLKWLRETFRKQFEYDASQFNESIYEAFSRYACETPAASDGLIFLPYLTGERSPDWKADVRGLMYGLDYSHGRKHIIRAAMEGVMYRMYSVYEVMSKLNDNAKQIRANGGYVKSDVWLQIQADIFNKEILVSGVGEASALGAAYLAMVSVGAVSDIKKLLPAMESKKIIRPIAGNHEVYKKAYELSKQIYGSIYNKQ
jgi:gluconokinase